MTRLRFKNVACIALLSLGACVVRLKDRNSPAPNGNVTGPAADCSVVTPLPRSEIGGAAEVKYVGRFDFSEPGKVYFDWSGNYIEARFEGSQVVVGLTSEAKRFEPDLSPAVEYDKMTGNPRPRTVFTPDEFVQNRFTWVLDDGDPQTLYVHLDQRYTLVTDLDPGPHKIVLHKETEPQSGGRSIFTGFDFGNGMVLQTGPGVLPPVRRPRTIEIIGDSITCGYGIEGKFATCPYDVDVGGGVKVPKTENNYLAYGSIAARELDADVITECWSGKGVYRNYKNRARQYEPNSGVTIPEHWQRLLANRFPGEKPKLWDFAAETADQKPEVVVINLGTNDFSQDMAPDPVVQKSTPDDDLTCIYGPEPDPTDTAAVINYNTCHDRAKAALGVTKVEDIFPGDNFPDRTLRGGELETFFQKYLEFVGDVRSKRPDAHIFLAVPPMVTDLFPDDDARINLWNVLNRIVAERNAAGDQKIYAMELVEQGTRYGLGCDYHPNLDVHRIMADQLVGAIRSKTCW